MSASAIDFKTTATYTVRLGDSLSAKDLPSSRFTSVKYNHKPKLRAPKYTIKSRGKHQEQPQSILNIEDGSDVFQFKGEHDDAEDTYVLVLNKDKEFVLEKLNNHHVYNLTSASSGEDESELLSRYPQLSIDDDASGDEDMSGREDEDLPADPKNPFDFRNLLKKEQTSKPKADLPRSVTSTPNLAPSSSKPTSASTKASGTTPTVRPTKATSIFSTTAKRKAATTTTKPATTTKSTTTQPQKRTKTDPKPSKPAVDTTSVPKVHLQRKASIHPSSSTSTAQPDDSGELILENIETPITTKPSAMSLALNGQLGGGPISLRRSAASSPAAALSSQQQQPHSSQPEREEEESDADGEEEDGDVEDLILDKPGEQKRAEEEEFILGDEDDDLSKELAAAFEGGEEDAAINALAADSDEESEEE